MTAPRICTRWPDRRHHTRTGRSLLASVHPVTCLALVGRRITQLVSVSQATASVWEAGLQRLQQGRWCCKGKTRGVSTRCFATSGAVRSRASGLVPWRLAPLWSWRQRTSWSAPPPPTATTVATTLLPASGRGPTQAPCQGLPVTTTTTSEVLGTCRHVCAAHHRPQVRGWRCVRPSTAVGRVGNVRAGRWLLLTMVCGCCRVCCGVVWRGNTCRPQWRPYVANNAWYEVAESVCV